MNLKYGVRMTDNVFRVISPFTGSRETSRGTYYKTVPDFYQSAGSLISHSNAPAPFIGGSVFRSEKVSSSGATITGEQWGSNYHSWPLTSRPPDFIPLPETYGVSVTELLAKTNPSKPLVDLPVAIAELRELPMLIFSIGRGVAKDIASGHLTWQFGWRPLLNDLKALLDFQDSVAARAKHLGKLRTRGGSSHTSKRQSTHLRDTVDGGEAGLYYRTYHRQTSYDEWTHVRWIPSYDHFGTLADVERERRAAFRSVLGLTFDLSTVWELLPWSWLADYFFNVGSYLSASRNIVGYIPGPCYAMRASSQSIIGGYTPKGAITVDRQYERIRTVKRRDVIQPSPLEGFAPFLSKGQLANIAAVIVSRR